jgi:ADP-heptose:LPS heptosyltransferase
MGNRSHNFAAETRNARNVVVIDLGFLGDSVHLMPALAVLRAHYARAAIHVVTTPLGASVLDLCTAVDRTWPVELNRQKRSLYQQWSVIRALRNLRPEVAINFSGADRTLFYTALIGARRSVVQLGDRRHFWSRWLSPHWLPPRDTGRPVFEQRCEALASLGFSPDPVRFAWKRNAEAVAWAAEAAPDRPIHISLSASTPMKEWPLENWINLGRRIAAGSRPTPIAATASGSERERSRIQAFAAGAGSSAISTFPGLPMDRLVALIGRCRGHIGADSGPLHLAMAAGIPTISLFRDYPGRFEWLPQGRRHHCLTAACDCIGRKKQHCSTLGSAACLAAISADQVAGLVEPWLTEGRP